MSERPSFVFVGEEVLEIARHFEFEVFESHMISEVNVWAYEAFLATDWSFDLFSYGHHFISDARRWNRIELWHNHLASRAAMYHIQRRFDRCHVDSIWFKAERLCRYAR